MLNFTDHIHRIPVLSDLALKHVQEQKFDLAREDLFNISINVNEAIQQLDDFIVALYQNSDPSRNQN